VSSEATGSVQVGGFALQVGGEGGTVAQAGGGGAEGTGALGRALAEAAPGPEGAAAEAAGAVENASDVTSNCEKAVRLGKGVAAGEAFDPDQLSLEVGTLLDLIERLDRDGRYEEELRLARAVSTLLMLLKRWSALLQTLRSALHAGEELGDPSSVAWAKHELGTLRLAGGDVEGAERDLRGAKEIRERIGDRRGLAATNRNLGALCERLRRMLRERELVRAAAEREEGGMRDRLLRSPVLRLLALAMLFALFFGAGVLAGDSGNSGREAGFSGGGTSGPTGVSSPTGHTGPTASGASGPTTGPTGPTTGPSGPTRSGRPVPLSISIPNSFGSVKANEDECAEEACTLYFPAGEEVTLTTAAEAGAEFVGFSGACTGPEPCVLTMTGAMSVQVLFEENIEPQGPTTTPPTTTTTKEGPSEPVIEEPETEE
jgi:hypothetical protein